MNKEKHKFVKTEYDELDELFEKIEKDLEKEFGKMCPDFEPLCVQCKFWNKFNNFKSWVFKEFL